MSCNCFTKDGRDPYLKEDNYYCRVCHRGMGNAYYAAAAERDILRKKVRELSEANARLKDELSDAIAAAKDVLSKRH